MKSILSFLLLFYSFIFYQAQASSWVLFNHTPIPIASIDTIHAQPYYDSVNPTVQLKGLGATSSLYYRVENWNGNDYVTYQDWQCVNEDYIKLNGENLTLSNLTEQLYRVNAIAVMAESQCQLDKFNQGKLIRSETFTSNPFIVMESQTLTNSTLTQPSISSYDLMANWPKFHLADQYKLRITKDDVDHFITVPSWQYDNELNSNGGLILQDQFNPLTQSFTQYTGFGHYKLAVSYCIKTYCTEPIASNNSQLIVKPTFDIDSSVIATGQGYNVKLTFETDSRTPKFKFYQYYEQLNNPDQYSYGAYPIELPDNQTTITTTHNGAKLKYQRELTLSYPGIYEIQIQPCSLDGLCQDAQAMGNITLQSNSDFISGSFRDYDPNAQILTGSVKDIDGGPFKIRLYHNNTFIEGTQVNTYDPNTAGYYFFTVDNLEQKFTQHGIDLQSSFNIELRALDHPSTDIYVPLQTTRINYFYNGTPTAKDDFAFAQENGDTYVNFLANDSDPNSFNISVYSYDRTSANGAKVVLDGNRFRYTPNPNRSVSTDNFSYDIRDEHWSISARATVTMIFSNLYAIDDESTLNKTEKVHTTKAGKTIKSIHYDTLMDVLANDININGLEVEVVIDEQPIQGTATVVNNQIDYQLNEAPQGELCVGYRMRTPSGSLSNRARSCTCNDEIFPAPDSATTSLNGQKEIDILSNDSYCYPNNRIEVVVNPQNQPTYGEISIITPPTGAKYIKYTPSHNFVGQDSFKYQLTGYDGNTITSPTQVTVQVGDSAPNTPPNLTASQNGQAAIDVSFGNSYASGYVLQHHRAHNPINPQSLTNSDWQSIPSNSATQRNYRLTHLQNGYHYFRVKSCRNQFLTCSSWNTTSTAVHINDGIESPPPPTDGNDDYTFPAQQDVYSAKIGTIAGSFRVNESGAATFSLPISIPKGIADVTPSLAMSYNSNSNNGVMGIGWGLSGLSSIQRCRQTLEQDGRFKAITLTNEDRFCLDGMRLIAISGNNGSDETHYRTETDTQQRVISYATSSQGPDYFSVEKPDGSISYYGKTNSTISANTTGYVANSNGTIIQWKLIKTIDNMGRINSSNTNDVNYYYRQVGNNEHLIDYISYSDQSIQFNYDLAETGARPDINTVFVAGVAFKQTARLDEIIVNNTTGKAIQSYHLEYDNSSPVNNQTQLIKVTQCNGSKTGVCLEPTQFDWNNRAVIGGLSGGMSFNVDNLISVIPLDFNGDNIGDFLYLHGSDGIFNIDIRRGLGDGTFDNTGVPYRVTLYNNTEYSTPSVSATDINADGISELLIRTKHNGVTSWKLYHLEDIGNTRERYVAQELVTGIFSISLVDLTGDGLPELTYHAKHNNDYAQLVFTNNNGQLADTPYAIELPGIKANKNPTTQQIETKIKPTEKSQQTNKTLDDLGIILGELIETSTTIRTKSQGVADFNGDGLTDILVFIQEDEIYEYTDPDDSRLKCFITLEKITTRAYTANMAADKTLSFEFFQNVTGNTEAAYTHGNIKECKTVTVAASRGSNANYIDLNNDGLTDIFYKHRTSGQWEYVLSNGNSFEHPVTVDGLTPEDDINNIKFIDRDSDGDLDLIYTSDACDNSLFTSWCEHINNDGNIGPQEKVQIYNFDPQTTMLMWMDVNADGNENLVSVNYDDKKLKVVTFAYDNHYSRIKKITNGFGASTQVNYKPMSDSSVYRVGTDAHTLNYGQGSRIFDLKTATHLVSSVETTSPSYDATGTNYSANNTLTVEYFYQGMRAQAGGRGLLGFERLISYDPQSNVTTETTYRQDFPYIGSPIQTKQCIGAGLNQCTNQSLLSLSTNYYNDSTAADNSSYNLPYSLYNDKVLTPHVYKNEINTYGLNSDGTTQFINKTVSTTVKEANSNGYLQTKHTELAIYDSVTATEPVTRKQTTNQYSADNTTYWWINRVSNSSVLHQRDGNSLTREVAFEYDATTGLLSAEINEPNSTNTLVYGKTHYDYDDYGNVITTTLCDYHRRNNCTATSRFDTSNYYDAVFRQSITTFDSESRHIVSTGNHLFNPNEDKALETSQKWNDWGQVTLASNVNGVLAESLYDDFGALYASKNDLGEFSKAIRRYKTDAINAGWPTVTEPHHYVIKAISAGEPTSYSYIDKLGRQVASVTQGLNDGQWVHQYTRYDKLGRVVRQSLPFYSTTNTSDILWSRTEYDIQGRVIKTYSGAKNNATALSISTISYHGLATHTSTTSSSEDYNTPIVRSRSQLNNVLGETIAVIENPTSAVLDSSGLTGQTHKATQYQYDVVGNLTHTQGADGQTIIVEYDDHGRKTAMNDPDKGRTTYKYNAAGELIQQVDALGYKKSIYRDSAGRTLKRSTSKWDDTTQAYTTNFMVLFHYQAHRLLAENKVNYVHAQSNDFKRCYGYDDYGRPNRVVTVLDGRSCHSGATTNISLAQYVQSKTFDDYGRVHTEYDGSADGVGITHIYKNGYAYKQVEANDNSKVLSEIKTLDARGNATVIVGANGKTTTKAFHPVTGLVQSIITDEGKIQDINYKFDGAGNLRQRDNKSSGTLQNFSFDNLNRLRHATGDYPVSISYDHNGNILTKSNVQGGASYQYGDTTGNAGPHAVTTIGALTYQYDAMGNQTHAYQSGTLKRQVDYNFTNKPIRIEANTIEGTVITTFDYDLTDNRYRRVDTKNSEDTTTYYIGNLEIVEKPSGVVETKRYVSNALQITRSNNTRKTQYMYLDHLGSIDTVTNESGEIESKLLFMPFGQRIELDSSTWSDASKTIEAISLVNITDTTNRGFTGHEHIDSANLIHMNGRIYDLVIGRFLQADPMIQDSKSHQNLNRYSYVLNNPLRYTDPSGFNFLDTLSEWMPTIMSIIITVATNGAGAGAQFFGAAMAGYVGSGFTLRGAAIGIFSAALFSGIGGEFIGERMGGFGHYLAHGLAGGLISVLNGGKFGHGFISAGLTKAFNVNELIPGVENGANTKRILTAAIIGGTLSAITGGKFANGAVTAAMGQALNGNSFWEKAKALGEFVTMVGEAMLDDLPGVALYKCATGNSCGYFDWAVAVADVAAAVLPSGALYKVFKMYRSGKFDKIAAAIAQTKAKMGLTKKDGITCEISCFVAGTQVLSDKGYVDIEKLEVGDQVWATNEETGESNWKNVTHTWTVHDKPIYLLTIINDEGETQTIEATDSHPFFVVGKGWVQTIDLQPNDTLIDKDEGHLIVESVIDQQRQDTAYNLTVADWHTYYVTERNVLVHNCGNTNSGADFIVTSDGVAVHSDQAKLRQSLIEAGATSRGPTTNTTEVGEIFDMNTSNGAMEIRIMQGRINGTRHQDARTVITRPNTREYIQANGARISGAVSREVRRAKGHVHGQHN